MARGLSEYDKYKMEIIKETKIGVAEALAKRPVPTIMNSGSGSGNNPMGAIGTKMMLDIVNDISK